MTHTRAAADLAFVDTHAHLCDQAFDQDRETVIAESQRAGVSVIIDVAFTPAHWARSQALSDAFGCVSSAVGVHPHHADMWSASVADALILAARAVGAVAIGETGVDTFRGEENTSRQLEALHGQLAVAAELGLPVIIHMRGDVERLVWDAVQRHTATPVLFHSFEGSDWLAQAIVGRGWFVGVGGLSLRRRMQHLRDLLARLPIECIVLETDAPYLAPPGWPSSRNTPAAVPQIATALAAWRGCALDEVAAVTTRTAESLFALASTGARS